MNLKLRSLKFGVVVFPGSNCDDDLVYVLRDILNQKVVKLWHKDTDLQKVDGVFIPGGFSYGDYLRSGALAQYSPIMQRIKDFAKKGGFIFGICNGFQILCETGLLPGSLLRNNNQKFICKNVYIKPDNNKSIITSKLNTEHSLLIPIAHAEGRYYANGRTISEMRKNGQILFRYSDEYGKLSEDNNPNGSVENIAGICNKEKNVFGMMPHPERAADDELGNTDGILIFESMLKNLK
ncbi:MAG: phosphoribosylformylglycinamidine synthase subunit PurQ [Bacteroidota bacterium]|nr:phosphoribosylformylglycinamidine synthase subunit PurQ [Bacteroidota bacterium]